MKYLTSLLGIKMYIFLIHGIFFRILLMQYFNSWSSNWGLFLGKPKNFIFSSVKSIYFITTSIGSFSISSISSLLCLTSSYILISLNSLASFTVIFSQATLNCFIFRKHFFLFCIIYLFSFVWIKFHSAKFFSI